MRNIIAYFMLFYTISILTGCTCCPTDITTFPKPQTYFEAPEERFVNPKPLREIEDIYKNGLLWNYHNSNLNKYIDMRLFSTTRGIHIRVEPDSDPSKWTYSTIDGCANENTCRGNDNYIEWVTEGYTYYRLYSGFYISNNSNEYLSVSPITGKFEGMSSSRVLETNTIALFEKTIGTRDYKIHWWDKNVLDWRYKTISGCGAGVLSRMFVQGDNIYINCLYKKTLLHTRLDSTPPTPVQSSILSKAIIISISDIGNERTFVQISTSESGGPRNRKVIFSSGKFREVFTNDNNVYFHSIDTGHDTILLAGKGGIYLTNHLDVSPKQVLNVESCNKLYQSDQKNYVYAFCYAKSNNKDDKRNKDIITSMFFPHPHQFNKIFQSDDAGKNWIDVTNKIGLTFKGVVK